MRLKAVLSILLLFGGSSPTEQEKITHLLNRMSFGPRPGDVELVQKVGIDKYLDLQLHPEKLSDQGMEERLASLPSLHMSIAEIYRNYPRPRLKQAAIPNMAPFAVSEGEPPRRLLEELQTQKIIRAVHSERQLQEVMTDFWFNHFNIFWGKGADRWLTTDFEMNVIRPTALV